MDKGAFHNEPPRSIDRPEDNDFVNDQETGLTEVNLERINKVYR